ncbi:MAG: DsrE family protein [Bradyrhizobium sp.]|uniref:DsrE/DsrF/TusD sulfur relay family protein n=1 Tax=Bradyrhizobium sp. TaxID=376 RepID=UPI0029BCE3A5|nr:DsrE family protein [Bradyrhizobium sp.]MDX3966918.1 DsrE family protein [Bradyrhizobium sp.]
MKTLFILNDPPYGSERCYNALRLASALLKKDPEAGITVFLMADAVVAAKAGQKTPDGYYNVERMLKRVLVGKGQVLLCGTCMDARGLADAEIWRGHGAAPWTSSPPPRSRPTRCWCSRMSKPASQIRGRAADRK